MKVEKLTMTPRGQCQLDKRRELCFCSSRRFKWKFDSFILDLARLHISADVEKKCPPPIAGKGIPLRRGKPSIEERNEAMDIFHTHPHPRWMFNLLTMSTNLHISGNGEWPAWRSDVVVEVEEIGFDTFSGGGRAASSKPSILDCQVISQTPNKRILLCV